MSRRTCPDCNEELQPIKIVDATLLGYFTAKFAAEGAMGVIAKSL